MKLKRKIRMGMVGGGRGAFVGAVHRMAAMLDNEMELVCGAFSSDPERSRLSGADWHVPADRTYGSYQEMFASEKKLGQGEGMDFVTIVTPNHMHYPVAKMALMSGFHVMCDKPMAYSLAEAKKMAAMVKKTKLLFGLTHNYTGYPMVKQARAMLGAGKLGKIRKIVVEYPQGWLSTFLESTGQKQAEWRTDPKRSGVSSCMGDIGTHAENLAEYMTGLKMTELCADLTTFVKGRKLDDDGSVLARLSNGGRMILYASQVATGMENNLRISVYGEKGSMVWEQVEPNSLLVHWLDRPSEIRRSGGPGLAGNDSTAGCRLPPGHPEGFIEAFANVYRNFGLALRGRLEGKKIKPEQMDFPSVDDGVRGMAFVETVVASSRSKQKWVKMKK